VPVELRALLSLILVPIAAFCAFGILDSSEAGPTGAMAYRGLYGGGILACLVALGALWFPKMKTN
jgi:hypothetical protein